MQNTMVNYHTAAAEETEKMGDPQQSIWKSVIEEMIDPASGMDDEEIKEYEAKIAAKLKRGKKLTAKEMEFLRQHNPGLYRTAMRVQLRKQQMEQQLKSCRSKAEAAEVARRSIAGISSEDPDKEYLVAGLSETMRQFKKSSAYARLPQTDERDQRKKRRGKINHFEEKAEDDRGREITPIQELLDILPTFDTMQ